MTNATRHFAWIDAEGREIGGLPIEGYAFRDYFDCDIEAATDEELAAAYRGPDVDGIGVRWTPEGRVQAL